VSKDKFDAEVVVELCAKYNLGQPGERYSELAFDGLPVLPFLIELAQLHNLDPEDIEVEHIHGGEGCDTCGYGSECDFIVRIK
jgi:hypothetical protein